MFRKISLSFFVILSFFLLNTAFSQVSGSGRACDFNSSYVSVPSSASLNPSLITIESWIKADSWAANIWENVIVSKDGWATGDQGYTLRAGANGSLSFNFGNGTWHEVTSGALMQTGKWYHVAGTFDGTTLRVYINGTQVGASTYTGTISATTYNLTIGKIAYASGGTRYFDGAIDEVRIWNTALSEATLKEYMCQKVTASHPNYSNLAGYWNFDTPGVINDNSINANNGALVGATQINSGAPIGNKSAYVYGAVANLSVASGTMDSLQVTTTGVVEGLHVYRVDGAPLVSTVLSSIDSVDQNHYYGVFNTSNTAASYTAIYHYGTNPLAAESYLCLLGRSDGTSVPWNFQSAAQNLILNTFTKSANVRQEFILGIKCPSLNLNLTGTQSFCEGNSITLSAQSPATLNAQWYNSAGAISGATNNSLVVSNADTYYLMANIGICAGTSASVSVVVNPIPVADFGTMPTTFCENDAPFQLISGLPSAGVYSGTGIMNTVFSPAIAGAGMHTLYYTVNVNGCEAADSTEVMVGSNPIAPIITQTDSVLCAASCETYVWFLNGNAISGQDSCLQVTQNGNYSVACINQQGCSSDTAIYILSDLAVGQLDFSDAFTLSPNPADDFVTVRIPNEAVGMAYIVLDEQGRALLSGRIEMVETQISLKNVSDGVYFIQLQKEGVAVIRRVVKKEN